MRLETLENNNACSLHYFGPARHNITSRGCKSLQVIDISLTLTFLLKRLKVELLLDQRICDKYQTTPEAKTISVKEHSTSTAKNNKTLNDNTFGPLLPRLVHI